MTQTLFALLQCPEVTHQMWTQMSVPKRRQPGLYPTDTATPCGAQAMEATASRSALSRHRKRRLLEATEHVSSSDELRVVRAAAAHVTLRGRPAADVERTVGYAIRVLRNVKNNVYHRAMAARTLGLLMVNDVGLQQRLRLESEALVDALLQLINCCRRQSTQNADTRRVHVNCCLVISMLMAPTARQQLVVSLDSELLAMPARPAERDSGFLLLTISGRPETALDRRDDPPTENENGARVSRRVPAPSLSPSSSSSPPRPREWRFESFQRRVRRLRCDRRWRLPHKRRRRRSVHREIRPSSRRRVLYRRCRRWRRTSRAGARRLVCSRWTATAS
ncbi:hypothetical protein PINS_up015176 [Pythium insidiosum]|nr:hypothetical protein PINS_up015176 [Pythium insidiosum]